MVIITIKITVLHFGLGQGRTDDFTVKYSSDKKAFLKKSFDFGFFGRRQGSEYGAYTNSPYEFVQNSGKSLTPNRFAFGFYWLPVAKKHRSNYKLLTAAQRQNGEKMAKKNSGLGRGLDAIFLDNALEENEKHDENSITKLKISQVDPKSDQPRKYFDPSALEDLANSIVENGLLQPILVREYGEGRYQIIAGERRFRASKLAGITEIPAIVLERDDKKAAQIALIENIQREDLNPLEEALAYKSLAEEYDMTQEELSIKVGKSRSAVANMMRLLDLPDEILTLVASRELSAGHARTLLGVKDKTNMILLAERCVEEDLSVRTLEEEVKRINKPKKEELPEEEKPLPVVDYFKELEVKMQTRLSRKVKIEEKPRKKTLTLYYEDNEDLDEIIRLLCGEDFLEEI